METAEALDKAGYGENVRQRIDDVDPPRNNRQILPAPLTIAQKAKSSDEAPVAKATSGEWDPRLFKAVNDDGYIPEVFKTLRSRILHPLGGKAIPKTILVTSAVPQEGKSFVAANLGVSLAHDMDQHSLLVDCDLRRPVLAKTFGLDNSAGLVDYLTDNVSLSKLIRKTPVSTLSVLPSGISPLNPAELLSSSRMSTLVKELSGRYEDRIVIFDSPPLLVAAESSVLAGQVDAIILVVRQGISGRSQIQKSIDIVGIQRILGIVFNDQEINPLQKSIIKGYSSYQGNYYG